MHSRKKKWKCPKLQEWQELRGKKEERGSVKERRKETNTQALFLPKH